MYYFFMCSQQQILPLYPHFHIIPICSLHSNSLRPLSEIWHAKWRFHRRRNHIVLQGSGSPTTINDSCIIDLTPWTWPCNADLANHAHSKILWVITAKQNNVQLGALTAVQYNRENLPSDVRRTYPFLRNWTMTNLFWRSAISFPNQTEGTCLHQWNK